MTEEKENREQEYGEELFHNPNTDVNVQNNAEARRSSMPEMQTTGRECPISATVFEPLVMTVGLPTVNELLKALVWFWWIDETLSANLVYQVIMK